MLHFLLTNWVLLSFLATIVVALYIRFKFRIDYFFEKYNIVKSLFIPLVCLGMLLSGLVHLFFPDETEKFMSCSRNVRIVGAILLALILPAIPQSYHSI